MINPQRYDGPEFDRAIDATQRASRRPPVPPDQQIEAFMLGEDVRLRAHPYPIEFQMYYSV